MDFVIRILNKSLKLPKEILDFLDVKIGDGINFQNNNEGEMCLYKATFGGVVIGEGNVVVLPDKVIKRHNLWEKKSACLFEENGEIHIMSSVDKAVAECIEMFADYPPITEEEISARVTELRSEEGWVESILQELEEDREKKRKAAKVVRDDES
jgi:antitoxin component of MazEF toxin-antitoxin module